MKTVRCMIMGFAIFFCGSTAIHAAQYIPPVKRIVKVINKTWKFNHADSTAGWKTPGFNDAAWSSVNLPHSFEIPYWMTNMASTPTIGCYRKHITVDSVWISNGQRIFIEFEAAFLVAQVYVNGTLAGTHQGGYTGFSYDITPNVHAGDNVIAVRLNATWNAQIPPRAGEYIYAGGIYRNVRLVVTATLHVTWYGTFVTTPQATSASATVHVKTEIQNNAATSQLCRVVSIIVDSTGNEVARVQSTQTVAAGALDTFVQVSPAVGSPHLWTPDTTSATPPPSALNLNKRPYLYSVYTEVYDSVAGSSTLADNFVSPLGIRSIAWNTANGFVLNGNKFWLKGASVHQDHAGWCDATCNTGAYRDVKMVHDAGFNFIRGSHYPHSPAFLDACDSIGMIFWSEFPLWGIGSFSSSEPPPTWNATAYPQNSSDQTPFNSNALQQLGEMIRIYRNHPSIALWSMGNEFGYTSSATEAPLKNLLASMVTAAHTQDSTRPAGQSIGFGLWPDFNLLTDVIGLNGGNYYCAYTVQSTIPSLCTEYGSCTITRGSSSDSYTGCLSDGNINTNIACTPAIAAMANGLPVHFSWRPGVALWCSYDHGSNYGMGSMGMIDHARIPKLMYWFYRASYAGIAEPTQPVSGTPVKIVLTTDRDTITDDGTSDCKLTAQVQSSSSAWLSNSPAITFTDNSGKGLFPSTATGSPTITFKTGAANDGVVNGMCAIEYRCYDSTAGLVTITASSSGLTSGIAQVYVKHVSGVVGIDSRPQARLAPRPLTTAFIKVCGNRIVVPNALRGKKVALSMYDLGGRLVGSEIIERKGVVMLYNKKNPVSVSIVKLQAVK